MGTLKKIIGLSIAVLLLGCLTVGGVWAYFVDTENSGGNQIAAGTLDMVPTTGGTGSVGKYTVTPGGNNINGNVVFTKMRPGEQGSLTWTLVNNGSLPGTLAFSSNVTFSDVSQNEVENAVAGNNNGGNGDLDEYIGVKVKRDGNYFLGGDSTTNNPSANTGSAWTNPANAYVDGTNATTITTGNPSGSNSWGNYGIGLGSSNITQVRVRYDAWSSGGATSATQVPDGDGTSSGTYTLAQSRLPTGNGINSGTWTASDAGDLWAAVDEDDVRGTSGDAVYITSPTAAGSWQGFTFTAFSVPASATVTNVIVYERADDLTSGTNSINEFLRVGGVSYNGTARNPANSGTITVYSNTWATNPRTGSAWTVADVNGTGSNPLQQFGITSTDLNPEVRTYMVTIEVNYTYASNLYAEVDETSADDTNYIKGTTNTANFYHFTNTAFSIPTNSTITNLTITYRGRDGWNAATGVNNARAGIRVNGINYDTTDAGSDPGSTFTTYNYSFTANPNTTLAWTVADINGTGANPLQQFGIASSDGAPDFDASMVYATVNYLEYNDKIKVDVSWDGGSSWSSTKTTTLTSAETTTWYDVTAATSWTPAKLADGQLQVRALAQSVNTAEVINLDWLPIEVTYYDFAPNYVPFSGLQAALNAQSPTLAANGTVIYVLEWYIAADIKGAGADGKFGTGDDAPDVNENIIQSDSAQIDISFTLTQ